jgi:1,4-alpha-glucan branching enzyme
MYSSQSSFAGPNRYSARNNVKPVNFICVAPEAGEVSLVGDFNGWQAEAMPMRRQADGAWHLQVPLSHGAHRYLFCVDGAMKNDPKAQGIVRNEKNERVSFITVS